MRTVYDDPSTPFRNLIILKIFFEGVGLDVFIQKLQLGFAL